MSSRRGVEELIEDLGVLRAYFERRWSLYNRIIEQLVAVIDLERLGAAWRDRTFQAIYDRPLLIIAAMREAALFEGESHPLWAALRDHAPDPAAVTREAVAAALERPRTWKSIATRAVQTNDTSRAVCWLWPATMIDRPLALVDCGASAGLNLLADALPPMWGDVPVVQHAQTVARLGLDAHPVDLSDPDERRWLRACMWAGEDARIARFDQSVAAVDRLGAPRVDRADATEFAARIRQIDAPFVLAYQSIFRDYLPESVRQRYVEGMTEWVSSATHAAWIEFEAVDPGDREKPVGIVAHLPGGRTLELARCQYHPHAITIDSTAATEFAHLVQSASCA